MNRYCIALVFAMAVGPLIAEAQVPRGESESSIVAPSDVRETEQLGGAPGIPPRGWGFDLSGFGGCLLTCGLFCFGEIAFTGFMLTCLMPSRRRWRR